MHNLKFENYVLFSRLSENLSWRYSLSALRECSKEGREEPGYRVVFTEKDRRVVKQKATECERLEISSRKLEMPREHFMQKWAQ